MIETQIVKMLADVGEQKKGETYELDTATAEQYVKLKLAETADTKTDQLISDFTKTLEQRDEKLLSEISKQLSKTKMPAIARDPADEGSIGDWLVNVGRAGMLDHDTSRKAQDILRNKYNAVKVVEADATKANMSQGTGSQGGYLVPQRWLDSLLGLDGYEFSLFPNRATILPVEKGTALNVPVGDYTVVPNGTGQTAYANGVTVGFVAEGNSVSTTQPQFKQVVLTPKKIMGLCQVSNELLDNSPISVDAIVSSKLKMAIQYYINHRAFNGAGGSLDLVGIINHASVYKQSRNSLNNFKLVDAANMLSRLIPSAQGSAVWFMHPLNYANLVQLSDTSNRVVWLPNLQATGKPILTLFGMPVVPCESLPGPATGGGDVLLLNPANYLFGLNKELTVLGSPIYAMNADLFTYRFTLRIDGAPELSNVVTLADGVTTTSWCVQLDYVGS